VGITERRPAYVVLVALLHALRVRGATNVLAQARCAVEVVGVVDRGPGGAVRRSPAGLDAGVDGLAAGSTAHEALPVATIALRGVHAAEVDAAAVPALPVVRSGTDLAIRDGSAFLPAGATLRGVRWRRIGGARGVRAGTPTANDEQRDEQ